MIRISYFIGLLFLMMIAPWWVILPLVIAGIFVFDLFWEALVLSFLFEVIFGPPAGFMAFGPFSLTLILTLILFGAWHIRQNLMVYN